MKILPATFIAEQQAAIGRISLEASLIIAFFIPESEFGVGRKSNRACLCVVDDQQSSTGTDEVRIEYDYDAIGTGSIPALSHLYRRRQDSTASLATTIYNLWEANRLSESVPGVGKEYINIDILHADGTMQSLSPAGYKYLRTRFAKYGPKEINPEHLEMKDEFLEPYDNPPKPSESQTSKDQP